jgi:hypothetical protein
MWRDWMGSEHDPNQKCCVRAGRFNGMGHNVAVLPEAFL